MDNNYIPNENKNESDVFTVGANYYFLIGMCVGAFLTSIFYLLLTRCKNKRRMKQQKKLEEQQTRSETSQHQYDKRIQQVLENERASETNNKQIEQLVKNVHQKNTTLRLRRTKKGGVFKCIASEMWSPTLDVNSSDKVHVSPDSEEESENLNKKRKNVVFYIDDI